MKKIIYLLSLFSLISCSPKEYKVECFDERNQVIFNTVTSISANFSSQGLVVKENSGSQTHFQSQDCAITTYDKQSHSQIDYERCDQACISEMKKKNEDTVDTALILMILP